MTVILSGCHAINHSEALRCLDEHNVDALCVLDHRGDSQGLVPIRARGEDINRFFMHRQDL